MSLTFRKFFNWYGTENAVLPVSSGHDRVIKERDSDPLQKQIIDYYNATYFHYQVLWLNRHNRAMHFGFTDERVQKHGEALNNMNRVLARRVGIREGEWVLDAGSGVGGSAIWLAQYIGARVTGININVAQVERAARYAKENGVEDMVEFKVGNFTAMDFADATFDVLWAIESVCHALDKRDFVREAWRVLKPGGRLILADGFRRDRKLPAKDEALLDSWLSAWAVPNLATAEQFTSCLCEGGFSDIMFENVTRHVMPSSLRLYRLSLVAYPLARLLGLFGYPPLEVANVRGARDQHRSLVKGQWLYGIVSAIKR